MGKGGQKVAPSQPITWEEVKKHIKRDDKWIVIDGNVYDITNWARKHPGGSRVISHYAGQDATEAFQAFHNDLNFVKKYMKAIHIGRLSDEEAKETRSTIKEDFLKLRETANDMGLFKPSVVFFVAVIAHILAFEAAAYLIMYYYGTSWLPWLASLTCYVIVQGQIGWVQHDFGHLSVFRSTWLNHMVQHFCIEFIKGAASDWWNHMHFQHHAKPNVIGKDPDVRMEALFVLGEEMPKKMAKKKDAPMPYNKQHKYFFFIGPPLLFPVYFQFMIFRHTITRRKWVDLFWMLAFYFKFFYLYIGLLGVPGALFYYFSMRVLESHWFVWVTQSNHIPMEIDEDKEKPWLALQLSATCDVEKSVFNDWFTGHLNFQIEHHLFPTMPRHNLYKIQPLVQSLCKKHGVDYKVKSMWTAFADIIRSLKHSGQLWEHYYEAYHLH